MITNDKNTKKPYETAEMVLCGYRVSDVLGESLQSYEHDGKDITWSK